jgi:hypothetical protein
MYDPSSCQVLVLSQDAASKQRSRSQWAKIGRSYCVLEMLKPSSLAQMTIITRSTSSTNLKSAWISSSSRGWSSFVLQRTCKSKRCSAETRANCHLQCTAPLAWLASQKRGPVLWLGWRGFNSSDAPTQITCFVDHFNKQEILFCNAPVITGVTWKLHCLLKSYHDPSLAWNTYHNLNYQIPNPFQGH